VTRRPTPGLTERQLEVAQMVADGLTREEIAFRIGRSPLTVKRHVEDIAARLGGDGTPRARIMRYLRGLEPAPLRRAA
jgi:DNA-binding NarL/FixJ family response regulator